MRIAFCILALGTFQVIADPSPLLPFQDAVKRIVERHPSVGIQKADRLATEARNTPTHLLWVPSLSLSASKSLDDTRGSRTDGWSLLGKSELNLFRFGADFAAQRAATHEEEAQAALVDRAILTAEGEAVSSLVAYLQAGMELSVLRELVQMRENSLAIDEARYKKGLLAAQEVEKVRVDLENARARYNDSRLEAVQAETSLEALLGNKAVVLEWPWKDKLFESTARLPEPGEKTYAARPDWQAAQKKLEASDARAREAWGKIFPSLDARFTYGYFQSRLSGVTTRGPEWSALAIVTIPLFDRLAGLSARQERVQNRASAEWEMERIRRLAKQESRASQAGLEISLDTARARERNLKTSRKLYKDNLARFLQGLVSANDLSIDQERLFQSELFAIKGWAVVHLNLTKLCHASGTRVSSCSATLSP